MRKNLWIGMILLLVMPGFMFTVSCAKKTVKSDTAQMSEEQSSKAVMEKSQQEDMAAKEKAEMEKQHAMEAERLAQEAAAREAMAARMMFENEDIYFEFDSSALLSPAQDTLKRKAQYLRDNPDLRVVIEGNCDERGTNEYNLALGDRRANSAKAFLVDLGIDASRLSTISYGEERPVDPRHTEEAWAKNRRDHFSIE
jgi:peptidoglycan-associated lipoprotein